MTVSPQVLTLEYLVAVATEDCQEDNVGRMWSKGMECGQTSVVGKVGKEDDVGRMLSKEMECGQKRVVGKVGV